MNDFIETRQLKGNAAIKLGRFFINDIKTYNRASEYKTICEKVLTLTNPNRQIFWKMSESESTATIFVGNYIYLNEPITDSSTFINLVYREDKLILNQRGSKIFSTYLNILGCESQERALVYLYTSLIDLLKDPRSCEVFLDNIDYDLLSVDSIVHILNALSSVKNLIRNWNPFVERASRILIEIEGEENAKDLLRVIL